MTVHSVVNSSQSLSSVTTYLRTYVLNCGGSNLRTYIREIHVQSDLVPLSEWPHNDLLGLLDVWLLHHLNQILQFLCHWKHGSQNSVDSARILQSFCDWRLYKLISTFTPSTLQPAFCAYVHTCKVSVGLLPCCCKLGRQHNDDGAPSFCLRVFISCWYSFSVSSAS